MPLVSGDFKVNDVFSPSWGGTLAAEYDLRLAFPLALRLGTSYTAAALMPVAGIPVPGTLNELGLLLGAASGIKLSPLLRFRGFLDAGLNYGSIETGKGYPYAAAQAGIGLDMKLGKDFIARLDTAAQYKFGLAGGVAASLGVVYKLPVSSGMSTAKPRFMDFDSIVLANIFPALRSHYDEKSFGTVTITNKSSQAATNVRVSFVIRQYMDAPKECLTIARIEAGKSVLVPIFALLNDSILRITEATKVSGEITVEYNGDIQQSRTATILVYDRNALTWKDDRMAAAFVSSKDPWVLDLTGNILAAVMADRNPELAKNFQSAIAIHEGLKAYGITYMLSPNRPFAQAVVDTAAVDSLKFPRQTLGFRAGDCADLSVLYTSCFEAAGIETAFVTVPAHIFMAVDLGLSPAQAKARGMDLGDFIVQGEKVWLPLETTMRSAGFGEVWRKAAGTWREASAKGLAAIFPIHEAWNSFAPVGLPADGSTIVSPAKADVLRAFKAELGKIVDSELAQRLSALGTTGAGGQASVKSSNDRGVLYAKYGFYPEAITQFQAAAQAGSVSALINLGNIAMLKSDAAAAYVYYQQASKQMPGNAKLLVNIAKAAAALGKSSEAAAALKELRKLDPALADQYSWVATAGVGGARAAGVEDAGVLWF